MGMETRRPMDMATGVEMGRAVGRANRCVVVQWVGVVVQQCGGRSADLILDSLYQHTARCRLLTVIPQPPVAIQATQANAKT